MAEPTDPKQPTRSLGASVGTVLSIVSLGLLTAAPALTLNVLGPYASLEFRRFMFAIFVTGATALLVTGLVWLGSRRQIHRTLSLSAVIMLCLFQWPLFARAGELVTLLLGEFLGLAVVPVALAALLLFLAFRLADEGAFAVAVLVAALAIAGAPLARVIGQAVTPAAPLPAAPSVVAPTEQPDVYFLILDMYERGDVLANDFGFDNSEFVGYLEKQGFYVPDRARTNYSSTWESIASIFSMEYLLEPGALSQPEVQAVRNLSRNGGPVAEALSSAGYEFVYVESPWGVSACGPEVDQCVPYWNIGEAAKWLVELTIFAPLTETGSYAVSPTVALRQFRDLEALARQRSLSPRFIYAHIGIPHPPTLLDQRCTEYEDGARDAWESAREGESAYVLQLQCTNLLVTSFIDVVLDENPEAVVIITGDHGAKSFGQWATPPAQWSESAVREVMSVFSAYRLPAACRGSLDSDLELVSTFRVVINCLFGTDLSLLSGRYFYASPPHIRPPAIAELPLPSD